MSIRRVSVVTVDGGPGDGFAATSGAADTGQDQGDDLLAEGQRGRDGAGRIVGDVVAPGPAGFGDQLFAAELAQVVGALAGGVVGAGPPGRGVDLGGEGGDG